MKAREKLKVYNKTLTRTGSLYFLMCGLSVVCIMIAALFCSAVAQPDLNEGIRLFETEKISEAKKILKSVVKANNKNAEAHYYLGRVYFAVEEYGDAEKSFKKAVEHDDKSYDYKMWLLETYEVKIENAGMLSQLRLAGKWRDICEKILEMNPQNTRERHKLIDYYLNAPGIMGGSRDKAQLHAEEIRSINKLEGHRAFLKIYQKEKKYDLQEKEIVAAITIDSTIMELQFQLGYLYQNTKQYEKAFDRFERIVISNPGELNALYQIGRTSAFSGLRPDRGIECLRKFLQYEPSENFLPHYAAYYRLGMIYEHKNDRDAAVNAYEAALKLNPDYENAKKALKKLK